MRSALAATLFVLTLAACGDNSTPTPHEAQKEGMPSADGIARTPSPPGAKVFILEPKDGATVKNPITVKFGVEGMKVVPAGTDEPDSGHHHLLIDATVDDSTAVPADAQHRRSSFRPANTHCRTCSPTRATFRLIRLCNPRLLPSPSNSWHPRALSRGPRVLPQPFCVAATDVGLNFT